MPTLPYYAVDFPDLASRRAWIGNLALPANDSDLLPRKSRNKGSHSDLARPALMWWRATLDRPDDDAYCATSWRDIATAANDNGDYAQPAVLDHNPAPRHTAEALLAMLPQPTRVMVRSRIPPRASRSGAVETTRHCEWHPRQGRFVHGRAARLGQLDFSIERGTDVEFIRLDGKLQARTYAVAAGTMLRVAGRRVGPDVGRDRPARGGAATDSRAASASWYRDMLGGQASLAAAMPLAPAPRELFMGMRIGIKAAIDGAGVDSGVRSQVDTGYTTEDALADSQAAALFRRLHPDHARVLDTAMTARSLGELVPSNDNGTGKRRLRAAIRALEEYLAA